MLSSVYSLQKIISSVSLPTILFCQERHWLCAKLFLDVMAAKVPFRRWIKPEVYPLFLAIGGALGICGFTMARNLTINPDVRISKEDREAGVLENYKEGEIYKNHSLRKYLATQEPQIMPTINNHLSGAKN